MQTNKRSNKKKSRSRKSKKLFSLTIVNMSSLESYVIIFVNLVKKEI